VGPSAIRWQGKKKQKTGSWIWSKGSHEGEKKPCPDHWVHESKGKEKRKKDRPFPGQEKWLIKAIRPPGQKRENRKEKNRAPKKEGISQLAFTPGGKKELSYSRSGRGGQHTMPYSTQRGGTSRPVSFGKQVRQKKKKGPYILLSQWTRKKEKGNQGPMLFIRKGEKKKRGPVAVFREKRKEKKEDGRPPCSTWGKGRCRHITWGPCKKKPSVGTHTKKKNATFQNQLKKRRNHHF